ncbi:hypothetical protein A2701_02440 [Candidatus Amesbacteria bacterium RIFCSPHIGHO2_01_FULL_47_34]|nr:MAG: hypothetical protein A2701_02440 [Candidatus Amesbacteria bacterium RIFCSPHIGHO2_01_FULL_47_34]
MPLPEPESLFNIFSFARVLTIDLTFRPRLLNFWRYQSVIFSGASELTYTPVEVWVDPGYRQSEAGATGVDLDGTGTGVGEGVGGRVAVGAGTETGKSGGRKVLLATTPTATRTAAIIINTGMYTNYAAAVKKN